MTPDLYFQDTVSVHRPSFYADRFLKFMNSRVFKKIQGKILRILLTNFTVCIFARFLLKGFGLSPKAVMS